MARLGERLRDAPGGDVLAAVLQTVCETLRLPSAMFSTLITRSPVYSSVSLSVPSSGPRESWVLPPITPSTSKRLPARGSVKNSWRTATMSTG